jgi:hypothetical protein
MPKFLSGASSTSVRRPLRQYSQMVRSSSGDMRAAAARTSLSKPIVVTTLAWGRDYPGREVATRVNFMSSLRKI